MGTEITWRGSPAFRITTLESEGRGQKAEVSACDGHLWLSRAHDREPEHKHHFSQHQRLAVVVDLSLVGRKEEASNAEGQPAEAGEDQPDAEEAREEARPVGQEAEGDEPDTPEDRVG